MSDSGGLTGAYGRFVASAPPPVLPPEAGNLIRTGFIDLCATLIAGRGETVVAILGKHVRERGGPKEASLLLGHERAASQDAALLNGTAGHAHDYDDVALAGHPSTVLVPAILA